MQLEALDAEYKPAAHPVHADEALTENDPAGQAEQSAEEEAPVTALKVPEGQLAHEVACCPAANVPAAQFMHADDPEEA